jgi:hypothetical protein
MAASNTNSDDEVVRQRAYRLWEQRGRAEGGAEGDWFEAERQMRREDLTDADGNLIALPNERPDGSTRALETPAQLLGESPDSTEPATRSRKRRSNNGPAIDGATSPQALPNAASIGD